VLKEFELSRVEVEHKLILVETNDISVSTWHPALELARKND